MAARRPLQRPVARHSSGVSTPRCRPGALPSMGFDDTLLERQILGLFSFIESFSNMFMDVYCRYLIYVYSWMMLDGLEKKYRQSRLGCTSKWERTSGDRNQQVKTCKHLILNEEEESGVLSWQERLPTDPRTLGGLCLMTQGVPSEL